MYISQPTADTTVDLSKLFAMPKSQSLIEPSYPSSTLEGLMSDVCVCVVVVVRRTTTSKGNHLGA